MSVQTDLATAIDAYIQSTFTGTLAAVSAEKRNLEDLLKIQQSLIDVGGADTIANESQIKRNFTTFTFPANTTVIPIKGVRGTLYEVTGLGNPNGGLLITDITLDLLPPVGTPNATLPSGMGIFRMFLYNAAPASTITNASTWSMGADRDKMGSYPDGILLNNVVINNDGTRIVSQNFGLQHNVTLSATGSLFLYIANTTTAFTPAAASETGRIEIAGIQV